MISIANITNVVLFILLTYILIYVLIYILDKSRIGRAINDLINNIINLIIGSNEVTYYTHGDIAFKNEVNSILSKSGWLKKYKITETNDPDGATIVINLTERNDMDIFHTKPQYYPNGKQIRFSVTTQSSNEKPEIFIDKDNWMNGVPESGLTLSQYREYVINHEFGHGLGYDHQKCAGMNKPEDDKYYNSNKQVLCPVMYQMTRGVPSGGIPNYKVTDKDFTERIRSRYLGIL